MKEYLLGIDIGTSSCKIAVFSFDGTVVAQKSVEYKVYYPQQGWVEQNPYEWWSAVVDGIRGIFYENEINADSIVGIGVDGQSWSAIPIDKNGDVLCNTPIWMDTRAEEICNNLKNTMGSKSSIFFETCGNQLQPAYTLPKILWYKHTNLELYKKINKILQSNSYIVYRLTGAITQDLSQGYGMHCFSMRKGSWDYDVCRDAGINPSLLPELVACHQVVGKVSKDASRITGILEGTPVVAGGLDAACGTLGAGVIHSGETQEQGGQAGGMSICMDKYCADERLILSFHVVPNLWLLQGGTVGGGGVLRWFEHEFCKYTNTDNPFYEMDKEARKIAAGSDGLVFLPYMAGERSPIWDSKAKGVYYGLDYSKTHAHFIRASMEGVSFSLKHNLDVAESIGVKINVLSAMGGAANSDLWTQIKADITGKTIVVPSSDTATTLGAAILAGVGIGLYKDFDDAVKNTVSLKREHIPNPQNEKIYSQRYNQYLEIYQQLKEIMHK